MKENFARVIKLILSPEIEGGYVNDPEDPGGETKFGISKRAYPDLHIKNLTRDRAKQILYHDYWQICKCNELPKGVDILIFDCAINQGTYVAGIVLQQAIGAKVDGIIGPQTISYAQLNNSKRIVRELVALRGARYGKTSGFSRFGLGWMRRLAFIHQLALEIRL